jgi:hypothetical protein
LRLRVRSRLSAAKPRGFPRAHHLLQGGNQVGATQAQFGLMVQGKVAQDFFTFWGQGKQDFAGVFLAFLTAYVTSGGKTIDQFNRAVMADLKAFSQIADTGTGVGGEALQGEEELVLTRFETGGARGLFAEMKKTANLVTQFCQRFVIGLGERLLHRIEVYDQWMSEVGCD